MKRLFPYPLYCVSQAGWFALITEQGNPPWLHAVYCVMATLNLLVLIEDR